ncbi:tetratricopeptide repeat protein [Spirulina major CS-329]|nr:MULTISPECIES: tetratricopeptide repeat protein [Spirulina]MDB9495845.1 tetratricopeptide repeat protein [Spirulina subsalsa CS-330]MDB9504657.1 tetratricopeptide repeat protein [Spirulina major CS-329]
MQRLIQWGTKTIRAMRIAGLGLVLLLCLGSFEGAIAAPLTAEAVNAGESLAGQAIEALQQGDLRAAEDIWTQLIQQFPTNPAVWSNRGSTRVSQNNLEAAIDDFNEAMRLAPDAPDPYLNRGIAYEGLARWDDAIADYNRVLELDPDDAIAYNNRGNAEAGRGDWAAAQADYNHAIELEPQFSLAQANNALSLYELGDDQTAIQTMRNLVRKYPMFPDIRAALTAVLWDSHQQGEAESNWVAAMGLDRRYSDIEWVRTVRGWPPRVTAALERFLTLN